MRGGAVVPINRSNFQWHGDSPLVISKKIEAIGNATIADVHAVADAVAAEGMAHMKKAAPWTDRTGDARRTLRTEVEKGEKQTKILFRHGVHYGLWLEVRHGGRFSIVIPTTRKYAGVIMRRLKKIV